MSSAMVENLEDWVLSAMAFQNCADFAFSYLYSLR